MKNNEMGQIGAILLKQFKGEAISAEDRSLLEHWLEQSAANRAVFKRIQDEHELEKYLSIVLDDTLAKDAFQQFKAGLLKDAASADQPPTPASIPTSRKRIHLLTTAWVRYAAAIIIIVSVSTYFWIYNKRSLRPELMQSQRLQRDVLPGKNGAILTLANGMQVVLDSLRNGIVADQKGTQVVLNNGALNYDNQEASSEFVYNTMSTPKGRQFELVLSDGTHVWLNAASSIRYPSIFTGGERVVTLSGEAYFEVKHDDAHPFKVIAANQVIQDIGTGFNVKAYNDEPQVKTTLVEGSIKIGETVLNRPGQQLNGNRVVTANIALETAWRKGAFDFEDTSLREVMRQLARWYDIDVIYEEGVPDDIPFTGRISRKTSLQSLLKLLESTSLNFQLEDGRKLIIRKS
jgi:hypothetical protein